MEEGTRGSSYKTPARADVASFGGSMPGVATSSLSGAASDSFRVPSEILFVRRPGDTILIILFLFEGILISPAAGGIRSAQGQGVPGTARALDGLPPALAGRLVVSNALESRRSTASG